MRIIAGKFGGRILSTLRDRSIRPTTDRAKQTIFDMLSARIAFDGIDVLDLFAGSGSLGLEALSRGARSVVFVDRSIRSLNVLEQNMLALGCQDQCTVHQADVFWYLKQARQSFDLVFADPPYALERIGDLPSAIYEAGVVKPAAYVVMEHSRSTPVVISPAMYHAVTKPFGQTTVLILQALPHEPKRKDPR
jgi:16S rRNA (guanine(966)-N(2))-methyltransferase RsmD